MRILVLFLAVALAGCSVRQQTVTPSPIVSTHASADGNQFDSGIKSSDKDGFIVSANWLARYDDLLSKFGSELSPPLKSGDRNGVQSIAFNQFRVTAQVMTRFVRLNVKRKQVEAGP